MKREIYAAVLLLVIVFISWFSIHKIDSICADMLMNTERAYRYAEAGMFDLAEKELEQATALWLISDGYTHIFIRHTEIDSAADALFDAKAAISGRDPEEILPALEKLRYHLISIDSMEHLSLGSIL